MPGPEGRSQKSRKGRWLLPSFGAVVSVAIISLLTLFLKLEYPKSAALLAQAQGVAVWEPESVKILDSGSPVTVAPGSLISYSFTVPRGDSTRNFHLVGTFTVFGEAGNDIQVVICSEEDFMNWASGRETQGFYSNPMVGSGSFDVALPPGQYKIGFGNRFLPFTPKRVTASINEQFEKLTFRKPQ